MAEKAEQSTVGGVPASDFDGDADVARQQLLSAAARLRARRLAMGDGHPVARGERRSSDRRTFDALGE